MNILAIGAHFDDVELGCSGSLAKRISEGDKVYVYVATDSGYFNYQNKEIRTSSKALGEAKNAMDILGVTELITGNFQTLNLEFTDSLNIQILEIIEKYKIDFVYTHWTGDIHHDHKALAKASLHSCRHVPNLLMYRSNWYHSDQNFNGNYYVDITDFWEIKEKAIRAHETEMKRTGESWISFFENEAENAGQRIGVKKAEVFQVIKLLSS